MIETLFDDPLFQPVLDVNIWILVSALICGVSLIPLSVVLLEVVHSTASYPKRFRLYSDRHRFSPPKHFNILLVVANFQCAGLIGLTCLLSGTFPLVAGLILLSTTVVDGVVAFASSSSLTRWRRSLIAKMQPYGRKLLAFSAITSLVLMLVMMLVFVGEFVFFQSLYSPLIAVLLGCSLNLTACAVASKLQQFPAK